MKIKLIRHATMQITVGGTNILVDPMLSPAGAMGPVADSPQQRPNPLVPLPVPVESLLNADAVLLTHTHRDHFDDAAAKMLPKSIPVLCQPADGEKIASLGFTRVLPVDSALTWRDLTVIRTGGQHGSGEIGRKMGAVSGYVLQHRGESLLYIAGDTIWCREVSEALDKYSPKVAVLYAGAARFLTGGPIIMDAGDVVKVCRQAAGTKVVAVHLEAFNHCLLSRNDLRRRLETENLGERVLIPGDGEELIFPPE